MRHKRRTFNFFLHQHRLYLITMIRLTFCDCLVHHSWLSSSVYLHHHERSTKLSFFSFTTVIEQFMGTFRFISVLVLPSPASRPEALTNKERKEKKKNLKLIRSGRVILGLLFDKHTKGRGLILIGKSADKDTEAFRLLNGSRLSVGKWQSFHPPTRFDGFLQTFASPGGRK